MLSHWIRPTIRELSAYHVPPAAGLIKLDAMENPYSFPEELKENWLGVIKEAAINRYPDPGAHLLKERLRVAFAIPREMELLLGNGSDELIQIIALAVAETGRVILAPEPTFVMYRMIALYSGMNYVGVPLTEDFALDLPAMLKAIEQHQPAVVFLAYPNNPTGNLFEPAAVAAIIAASPGLVVVDEAYHAYAQTSFLDSLGEWPNLLVMRTLSKLGLAGLRLGILSGPPEWLNELDKLRLPYNINILSQLTAELALTRPELFAAQTDIIREERQRLATSLARLPGLTVYPSAANFLLLRTPMGQARRLFADLKQAGILVKCLDGSHPHLADCLRITIGTPQENEGMEHALSHLLS